MTPFVTKTIYGMFLVRTGHTLTLLMERPANRSMVLMEAHQIDCLGLGISPVHGNYHN